MSKPQRKPRRKPGRTLALLLCALATVAQTPAPKPALTSFAYARQIFIAPGVGPDAAPYACAVLDGNVFAHTGATLADLRIFNANGRDELPYAVTLSRTASVADPARILNLGLTSPHRLSFDLAMPPRPYSAVDLTLDARDFVATAKVTGLAALNGRAPVFLGIFTLFDLSGQGLGSNSSLAVAESTFPYLHVEVDFAPAAGNAALPVTPAVVAAAEVPPSREAQTLYTGVAQSFAIEQRPRETVARFTVAAHVPIERIAIGLDPGETLNFNRPVIVTARALQSSAAQQGEAAAQPEQLTDGITRVDLLAGGRRVRSESLAFPAILGANAQSPATVEVAIQNGDDRPLKVPSVRLEMRQRKLCFTPSGDTAILAYGAPAVAVPVYDFGRTFNPAALVRTATLAKESANALFVAPAPRRRSFTERYPQVLWLALVLVVSLLGFVAFRSAKSLR